MDLKAGRVALTLGLHPGRTFSLEDAATLERPKVPSAVAIWSIVLHTELRVGASEITSAYQKDLGKASFAWPPNRLGLAPQWYFRASPTKGH